MILKKLQKLIIIIILIILSLHCVTEVVPPSNAAARTPKQNRSQGTQSKTFTQVQRI